MPYVTSADRYETKMGEIKGLSKAIEAVLKLRFPAAHPSPMPRLLQARDVDRLQHLLEVALTATLDEIETAIESAVPASN